MGLLEPDGRYGHRDGETDLTLRSTAVASYRTLDDLNVRGKRVLVRLDLNVPMKDGKVTDATRIERQAPTVSDLSGKGARVIVL